MKRQTIQRVLLTAIVGSSLLAQGACGLNGKSSLPLQGQDTSNVQFNPLRYLTNEFPDSVKLKRNGHLLEFCPDNTCDGFASRADVPQSELRDFAYLYEYFFSGFVVLKEWREHPDATNAANRVLSKVPYSDCRRATERGTARCILLDRSRGGRIRLMFVRYDENERNVVPEDVAKMLSATAQ